MSSASAAMLEEIAVFDEKQQWQRDGATSMTAWLAARYGMARATTRELVRVAKALRRLPTILNAYAAGQLSFDQLKPLTRFATGDDDGRWAKKARDMSPAQLWAEARRREERSRQQALEDSKLRYLWMGWDEDRRFLHLEGMFSAEQGAVVEQALERSCEDVVAEEGVRDPEGARLADALVELAASSRDGSGGPCVVVHTDVSILADAPKGKLPGLSETESGIRLADETVRRLACDATIDWVVEAGGAPVGMGRRARSVPSWLLRLLRHRDPGCRFPGCERRRWLKAHHIWHWGQGGPTDLDNLVLLCHAHHRLIHEGGWSVSGHPGARLRFHDPGGRIRPGKLRVAPREAPAVA
jgi:uncharacterized protein DUF222/HNH endonuclease